MDIFLYINRSGSNHSQPAQKYAVTDPARGEVGRKGKKITTRFPGEDRGEIKIKQ